MNWPSGLITASVGDLNLQFAMSLGRQVPPETTCVTIVGGVVGSPPVLAPWLPLLALLVAALALDAALLLFVEAPLPELAPPLELAPFEPPVLLDDDVPLSLLPVVVEPWQPKD